MCALPPRVVCSGIFFLFFSVSLVSLRQEDSLEPAQGLGLGLEPGPQLEPKVEPEPEPELALLLTMMVPAGAGQRCCPACKDAFVFHEHVPVAFACFFFFPGLACVYDRALCCFGMFNEFPLRVGWGFALFPRTPCCHCFVGQQGR